MYDAMDVVRHLIRYGYDPICPEESVYISPLRLQKLLYYCQGWSLALLGRPLFRQQLEAWTWGPVVSEVYERFQGTREGITPERAGEPTELLSGAAASLVEMVWSEYARYTPTQLVEMTHSEPAWREARQGQQPEGTSFSPLSAEIMANYFRDQARKRGRNALPLGYPVIDPAEAWKAEEEFERSGASAIPAEDVFGKLLLEAGE